MTDKDGHRIYQATGTPLTVKQTKFIKEVIKTGNATTAVMKVYDVKNKNTASRIANQNLQKDLINKSIKEHLATAGYNPQDSINRLQVNAQTGAGVKATASDSIRADELLLKLAGMVVDRSASVSLNVDVSTLSKDKLLDFKSKFDKLLEE